MNIVRQSVTWFLSGDAYETGAYANGDPWVVGPVTITGILPFSFATGITGSTINSPVGNRCTNGSMINPVAGNGNLPQGFDSYLLQSINSNYSSGLNVARPNSGDLSESNPLIVSSGSLISMGSWPYMNRPMMLYGSVLTIVPSAPPSGAFRPYYCGSGNKYASGHAWNITGLDWGVIASLPPAPQRPSLTTMENDFSGVWIEIQTETAGRYYHPTYNQPDYGGNMAQELANALTAIHTNYTQEEKTTLVTRLVQYGIDVYGAALAGGEWSANGGHNMGRKMPMILAGAVFQDSGILSYANGQTHFIFQEDQQTFIVDTGQEAQVPYIGDGRERTAYSGRSGIVSFTPDGNTTVVNWPDHQLGAYQSVRFSISGAGNLPPQITGGKEYLAYPQVINATDLFAGQYAEILSAGTTNFTLIGAPNNNQFTFFRATGPGVGDGTVYALPQDSFKLIPNYTATGYSISSAGDGNIVATCSLFNLPEWGEKHDGVPDDRDGSNWNVLYRNTNYAPWLGHWMCAKLTSGASGAWNYDPYFMYMDRAMTLTTSGEYNPFLYGMWYMYGTGGGGDTPPIPTYIYRRLGRYPRFRGLTLA